MNHTNTTDVLRITTSSTADLDVVIDYQLMGTIDEKPHYVTLTTIDDHDMTLADAGKVQINSITIKNDHVSTSNTVTISKYNGTAYNLITQILAAGERLYYSHNSGWTLP